MKKEILALKLPLRVLPRISRHKGGFKLYLPGLFVAANDITPAQNTVDVGTEPAAENALAKLIRR